MYWAYTARRALLQPPTNNPGGRYSIASWMDTKGDLWLFGGHGYPATGTTVGFLNDLWEFQPITILPVNWLGFAADPSAGQVLLTWQTSEEEKSAYFNVQRSTDGVRWQMIGTVDATGTSYQFTDKQPLAGMNYYRLQLNEVEGENQYSSIATADYQTGQTLICYATGVGTMEARLQNGSGERYSLLDMNGRVVTQSTLQGGQATLGPLVHGMYILLVATRTGTITEKIDAP